MIVGQLIGACIFWMIVFRFASDQFEWGWDGRAVFLAAVALCAILLAIRTALVGKEAPSPPKQEQQQQQQNVTVNIMLTDEQLEAELEKRKRGQG